MDDDFKQQRMIQKFDKIFLLTYCLQYFNGGFKFLMILSVQDLFKNYFKLQPTETQVLIVIILSPWLLKVVYGVTCDTIQIFGSRKKSWLIIMGILQFTFFIIAALVDVKSKYVLSILLMMTQLAGAFMDTVVDAMMVIQAKRDPENGSQFLQSLAWGFSGISAVCGGIIAAFVLQYRSPYVCFGIYSVFGIIISLFATRLTQAQEEDPQRSDQNLSFSQEFTKMYHTVTKCLQEPCMNNFLLYFFISGFTVPHFNDFMYYFKTEVLGFNQMKYSLLTLVGASTLVVGVLLYQKYFSHLETRLLYQLALGLHVMSTIFDLALVLRWNIKIGIPDIWWIVLGSTSLGPLQFAFGVMPAGVVISKITPASVEATVFAFTQSVMSLVFPVSKLMGALWNYTLFQVSYKNLDDLYKLYLLQLICLIIPFCFIKLIPTWAQIKQVQQRQQLK